MAHNWVESIDIESLFTIPAFGGNTKEGSTTRDVLGEHGFGSCTRLVIETSGVQIPAQAWEFKNCLPVNRAEQITSGGIESFLL